MSDQATAWARLIGLAEANGAATRSLSGLFGGEPDRLARLSLEVSGLYLDLSKQAWSLEELEASLALARASGLEPARDRLFAGKILNPSEGRPALHMALRASAGADFHADGEPVSAEIEATLARIFDLASRVRSGTLTGATGQAIRTVIHIGIGGSDFGPRLAWEALKPLDPVIDLRFIANVDPAEAAAALVGLDPATTLVVVVSKTFTTQETVANAATVRTWLRATLGEGADAHLLAVTAAPAVAEAFGVAEDRIFGFRDWVGGRYSVWSAVGLSVAIGIGPEAFGTFLAGARVMDTHFCAAPLEANGPVLLALAHIFNRNVLGRSVRGVVPYAQRLRLLPNFLQQLEMESNGKAVDTAGRPVAHATATTVFGDAGTNVQHAFFQLIHQGTDVIPLDILAVAEATDGDVAAQPLLLANPVAQAEALMVGRSEAEVRQELAAKGMEAAAIDILAPQKTFTGNRPTSFILLKKLDPATLGALLALYEHKTFVEGVIWGINSFDQWGVELGKVLASRVLGELQGGPALAHDPSTAELIRRLR